MTFPHILAEMSSSRSDNVTQSISLLVTKEFFLSLKMICNNIGSDWCLKSYQGNLRRVSSVCTVFRNVNQYAESTKRGIYSKCTNI